MFILLLLVVVGWTCRVTRQDANTDWSAVMTSSFLCSFENAFGSGMDDGRALLFDVVDDDGDDDA